MKLGELYQTVVLRDLLGYIVPGGITLCATSMLAKSFGFDQLGTLLPSVAMPYPWIVIVAFLCLAYLAGHIVDQCARAITRRLMGPAGLAVARQSLCGCIPANADQDLHRPLLDILRTVLAPSQFDDFLENRDITGLSDDKVRQITRLCDQYVFVKRPEVYHNVIGRAEVLHTFTANCGISLVFLAIALLLQLRLGNGGRLQTIQPATVHVHVVLISAIITLGLAGMLLYRSYRTWQSRNKVCLLALYTP